VHTERLLVFLGVGVCHFHWRSGPAEPETSVAVIRPWLLICSKVSCAASEPVTTEKHTSAEATVFIHSFILDISIAPLQVHYYSEALPNTALILKAS